MKNIGKLDTSWNPIKPGGLTGDDINKLTEAGWKKEVTGYDVEGVDITFNDPEVPTGIVLYKVDVPKGTEYFYHAGHGGAILSECGNATCWRHLMK